MIEFREWESFYVIVGSSAGALIGLQFVVMTLIAEKPPKLVAEGSAAFATPTVVHFVAVLLLSAVVAAPWGAAALPAVSWGLVGLCGILYVLIVTRRMRRQGAYRPELEDWVFYGALPLFGYGLLAVSALIASGSVHTALFGVGGAALLLLVVGIHNAWDSVTYQVVTRTQDRDAT